MMVLTPIGVDTTPVRSTESTSMIELEPKSRSTWHYLSAPTVTPKQTPAGMAWLSGPLESELRTSEPQLMSRAGPSTSSQLEGSGTPQGQEGLQSE